jgi:hypothetical protein
LEKSSQIDLCSSAGRRRIRAASTDALLLIHHWQCQPEEAEPFVERG